MREVLEDLRLEIQALVALDPAARDTTLLIVPGCLHDFLDFNDFMGRAERAVRKLGLEGVIQLASFHPSFQFAGSEPSEATPRSISVFACSKVVAAIDIVGRIPSCANGSEADESK